MEGNYVLVIELPEGQTVKIGSLKAIHLPCGYYAYVGSAMGGFRAKMGKGSLKSLQCPSLFLFFEGEEITNLRYRAKYCLETYPPDPLPLLFIKGKGECILERGFALL